MRVAVIAAMIAVVAVPATGGCLRALDDDGEAQRAGGARHQHVARQADDDGYRLGPCSRISSRQVNCDVDYYGQRSKYGC